MSLNVYNITGNFLYQTQIISVYLYTFNVFIMYKYTEKQLSRFDYKDNNSSYLNTENLQTTDSIIKGRMRQSLFHTRFSFVHTELCI